jgi:choline dehydrogenase-like flavoprotein
MLWLSKDVEQLLAQCQNSATPYAPEVVVIGSGYGGSVAALRFAEQGLSVAVLERGGEYLAGDFPTDLSQTGAFIRAESSATAGATALGNEDALFDFRLGNRATALVGNGLGGGSLINAAVALRPDARVFEHGPMAMPSCRPRRGKATVGWSASLSSKPRAISYAPCFVACP